MSEPKKSLGQHWLNDADVLNAVVRAADVGSGDTVLEIGPGLGSLTKKLASKAAQVIAVELDKRLAAELPVAVRANNLLVVNEDILRFDLTSLPHPYKVVANIPYYLTNNLLRTLLESPNPPQKLALLVQKEVAERVAAQPGQMSILAVSVQYYCAVELGTVVPAHLFTPAPKVDSQILKLIYHQRPLFEEVDTKQYFKIVKAGFSSRRKTLLNSLSAGLQLPKEQVSQALQAAGIDPQTRAQELSLEQWYNLYKYAKRD